MYGVALIKKMVENLLRQACKISKFFFFFFFGCKDMILSVLSTGKNRHMCFNFKWGETVPIDAFFKVKQRRNVR